MDASELAGITDRVRAVAERIQPQLAPHAGIVRRNAHAHVWLGLKVRFGDDWRDRAAPSSVHAFLDWIELSPNGEYEAYTGPVEFLTNEQRGELF
jgi:hypothetical protein